MFSSEPRLGLALFLKYLVQGGPTDPVAGYLFQSCVRIVAILGSVKFAMLVEFGQTLNKSWQACYWAISIIWEIGSTFEIPCTQKCLVLWNMRVFLLLHLAPHFFTDKCSWWCVSSPAPSICQARKRTWHAPQSKSWVQTSEKTFGVHTTELKNQYVTHGWFLS